MFLRELATLQSFIGYFWVQKKDKEAELYSLLKELNTQSLRNLVHKSKTY